MNYYILCVSVFGCVLLACDTVSSEETRSEIQIAVPDVGCLGRILSFVPLDLPKNGTSRLKYPWEMYFDLHERTGNVLGLYASYGEETSGTDLMHQIDRTKSQWRYNAESMQKLGLAVWRKVDGENKYAINVDISSQKGSKFVALPLDRQMPKDEDTPSELDGEARVMVPKLEVLKKACKSPALFESVVDDGVSLTYPREIHFSIDDHTGSVIGICALYGENVMVADLSRRVDDNMNGLRSDNETLQNLGVAMWRDPENGLIVHVVAAKGGGAGITAITLGKTQQNRNYSKGSVNPRQSPDSPTTPPPSDSP